MRDDYFIQLNTITPIHIGNGKILSPYNDFIYEDHTNTVYILDQQKIQNTLVNLEEKVMDNYVALLMNKNHQQNPYSLKRFFNDLGISYKELALRIINTEANIKNEQIHETIKIGTRPYIPGSSIKGAIRTALLYYHRKEKGYGIKDALQDVSKKYQRRKKSPNGEDLFGEKDEDIFKFLHVSDTNSLSPEEIEILKINRFHLKKKSTTISIITEVIPAGKQLNFRIQSKAKRKLHKLNPDFSYFYEEWDRRGEKEILHRVNAFSKELLVNEINMFQQFSVPVIKVVINALEQLYEKAEQFEKEKNGAVIRLGSGKTFYDNTINLLFSREELKQLRSELKLGTKDPFPVTRSMIESQGIFNSVLGWAALELKGVK